MKMFAAASVALCTIMGPAAYAQSSPVVVELFTSQGCSSCPPADKLLHELAKRDDVLPLAMHVDYWDYIGWADSFARPENTDRQRAYAHAAGRNMIYTPQMIVNGQDDVVGTHRAEVSDLIAAHHATPPSVALRASRDGGAVAIRAELLTPVAESMMVLLLRYSPTQSVRITRGENAGRTFDYANVVEGWRVLAHWDGAQPLALTAEIEGAMPAAILLQHPGPGAIVAAARVE